MKTFGVLAVVHMGRCENDAAEGKQDDDQQWHLGEIWAPGAGRGIGPYFQVFLLPEMRARVRNAP